MSSERLSSSRANGPSTNTRSPWGVVLLAHGSQRGSSSKECSCAWLTPESDTPNWCRHCPNTPEGLQDIAGRLRHILRLREDQLIVSCLEFIEPHPAEAIQMLAERGLRRVVVMPLLLGHGKHATLEMDEVLDQVRAAIPGVQLHLAEGLGADPGLAELVLERIQSRQGFASRRPRGNGTTGVLLVKAGTQSQYDDCLWLEDLGQMVEERLGREYALAVAQSHYGDPTMEAGAARLVKERRASSILCVPYLFFPGMILQRNVLGGMDRLRTIYPDLSMAVAPPLGVDDRVIAAASERIREIWEQVESTGR